MTHPALEESTTGGSLAALVMVAAGHPEDAAQVQELLRPTVIAVLCGDVYVKRAGWFESGYENCPGRWVLAVTKIRRILDRQSNW